MTPWEPDAAVEPEVAPNDAGAIRGIVDFVTWFLAGHYVSASPGFEFEPTSRRQGGGQHGRAPASG